jgi:hypothetical protein
VSRLRRLVGSLLPRSRRRRAAFAWVRLRTPTGRLRMLPDFLVIGAQRCGTSSLYRYLGTHPQVAASFRKETEFFSVRYDYGLAWYRAHFPLEVRRAFAERLSGRRLQAFEATPDYLFHPLAAERAAELVPNARLVALLRDPVERAFSHYRHSVRLGRERLDFASALAAEPERLAGEEERLRQDSSYRAPSYLSFSYCARGLYAEQLERWLERYPRERLLVVRSEDFFSDPPRRYSEILRFLELPDTMPPGFRNYSYREPTTPAAAMDSALRAELQSRFAAHNRRLEDLLGRRLGW